LHAILVNPVEEAIRKRIERYRRLLSDKCPAVVLGFELIVHFEYILDLECCHMANTASVVSCILQGDIQITDRSIVVKNLTIEIDRFMFENENIQLTVAVLVSSIDAKPILVFNHSVIHLTVCVGGRVKAHYILVVPSANDIHRVIDYHINV
jgi:hypothetical protein